jgi:hypothetical protein
MFGKFRLTLHKTKSYFVNKRTSLHTLHFTIEVSDYTLLQALANFYVTKCQSFYYESHIMQGSQVLYTGTMLWQI